MNVEELFNFFKSSPKDMFIDFREKGRKGEWRGGREREEEKE